MIDLILGKIKVFFFHFFIVAMAILVQFLYLNIMPAKLNNVDFFLILSALYVLKADYRIALPFIFFSVYVDEIIFPIAKILGLKTMAALILGYLLFLIFRKMVVKGWLLCLVVSVYCVLVFVLTNLFLVWLRYSHFSFPIIDYFSLFFNSFVITCLIGKKLNVW